MKVEHSTSRRSSKKYLVLAEQFRQQLREGVWCPGDKLPTFAQMQAEYGLSQTTLEHTYEVLEEEKLIVRVPGRGTFVSQPQAPSLKMMLGVATGEGLREHPYYLHLLKGIQDAAREAGVGVMLLHNDQSVGWEHVDGLLVTHFGAEFSRPLPQTMPKVALVVSEDGFSCVSSDDRSGMRAAIKHLIDLGHRRIGYLTLKRTSSACAQQRFQGYYEALAEAGIDRKPEWIRDLRGPWEPMHRWEEMGFRRMQDWIENGWEALGCTALLTHNDETAIGAIEALEKLGKRIPDDVSVVGYDGTEIADYFRPRLTTVRVPLQEIGRRAVEMLVEKFKQPLGELPAGSNAAASVVLPVHLRVGASTGPFGAKPRH